MTDADRRVGFVGLGKMGAPMAARLARADWEVRGYDPVESARTALSAVGGVPVTSAADTAADTVVLMLPDSNVVEAVLFEGGLVEQLAPGSLVIDMSSSAPLRTQAVAERLAEHGVGLVDAPVSGGVTGAVAGTLTIMLGGSETDAERASLVVSHLGRVRHVGPVGAGHALKALNNLLSATHLWATSEAMLVGERFGLDAATMLAAINTSSGRSGSTEKKWPDFVLPGGFDSGFSLALMLKDMKIATDLAHSLDIPVELGDAAVGRWAEASANLPSGADHTEIVRWLRASAASDSRAV
ncbi:3-hydroxyisobutyrate dehydrogenase [Microbacterium sp. AG1240]|uniref:NAD(P)-dependent oxidoreductase n=1 Tax=Microbacterium sp. AG1240 TaxID=2183992 RepID=UPI000EAEDA89|nr:NAD(P)-dependent oxidoreductase [Microbacterium sp. AG1240]RKT33534.1 3-hydroxyisobutyrate dehydrogenase [Microbacterium sp. AG1240]